MTSKSPSSIKDFYRAQVHNNNSNSAKSIYKRQLDSSDNVSPSFKIPRSIDHDVVTLEDSDDEDSLTNEFLPVRGSKYAFNLYPSRVSFIVHISSHMSFVNFSPLKLIFDFC